MAVCGLDIGKDNLDFAIGGRTGSVANSQAGLEQLQQMFEPLDVELVVMEATGGCERLARNTLYAQGFEVSVINPRRVRAFAEAIGQLAKTDRIDAGILARYGAAVECGRWEPPSAERQRLKELVRRRDQLVGDKTREQNRLKRASELAQESINTMLQMLKAELKRIENLIADQLNEGDLDEPARRLTSVPGVGTVIASVLLAEMPELGKVSSRQAGALAGVVPYANESGHYGGNRKPRGGRPRLRHALYMAVLVGMRHNPTMKAFYERLRSKGKPPKVAMVACMNKLIGWLNAMEREGIDWSQMETAKAVI